MIYQRPIRLVNGFANSEVTRFEPLHIMRGVGFGFPPRCVGFLWSGAPGNSRIVSSWLLCYIGRPLGLCLAFWRGMGLWTLLEGFLLLANALAVLNEDRFLSPRGWGFSEVSGGVPKSFKGRIIGFIYATQFLRVPLILLNSIFIIVKLVSG